MFKFECPKCGAKPHQHGKGGKDKCQYDPYVQTCEGLICDCDMIQCPESEEPDHGTSLSNPCQEANCYHCGWGGTVPVAPKGLQAWEKKALAAGWQPPSDRLKEIEGLR
jgi:hypothetical protein